MLQEENVSENGFKVTYQLFGWRLGGLLLKTIRIPKQGTKQEEVGEIFFTVLFAKISLEWAWPHVP